MLRGYYQLSDKGEYLILSKTNKNNYITKGCSYKNLTDPGKWGIKSVNTNMLFKQWLSQNFSKLRKGLELKKKHENNGHKNELSISCFSNCIFGVRF